MQHAIFILVLRYYLVGVYTVCKGVDEDKEIRWHVCSISDTSTVIHAFFFNASHDSNISISFIAFMIHAQQKNVTTGVYATM